jgi:hypothetical protein
MRRSRGMTVDPGPEYARLLDDPKNAHQSAIGQGIVRFVKPSSQVSDLKKLRRMRLSPPAALARWLDMNKDGEREAFWRSMKQYISPSSLPNILLECLHRSKYPAVSLSCPEHASILTFVQIPTGVDQSFYNEAVATLKKKGMGLEDVDKWAWIASAPGVHEMAGRFLAADCAKPPFLLLEILRREIRQVTSLKLLLTWTWSQLVGTPQPCPGVLPEPKLDSLAIPPSENVPRPESLSTPLKLEDSTSILIISRFLYQARRIWPPAIFSVAQMAGLIIRSMPDNEGDESKPLDPHMHRRLCKIHNQMLHLLSLPASINPLKSMSYNWQAQRVLIEMIGQFNPPLILDQDSYRAVAQVLAASKKSDREARAANLRTRSWPPWRVDQHGIDAQRSPEDDLSRVVSAGMRKKEAGYRDSVDDLVMRIIGGQEPDGTPTIQTRKLIKRRSRPVQNESPPDSDPNVWAARIDATRDIQEAWGAFKNFEHHGGHPNQRMYLAMFEKLSYNEARLRERTPKDAAPGDGKEVLMPSNDNMSVSYMRGVSPPAFGELYHRMILSGTRPSGRLLAFILARARTINHGIKYLRDSQLNSQAIAFLAGDREVPPSVLSKVPASTFAAFIKLLCRFTPRAVVAEHTISTSSETARPDHDSLFAKSTYEYRVIGPRDSTGQHVLNTLHRSMELLKASQTQFRTAWYTLFRALAQHNIVIDPDLVGDPRNDLLAWEMLFSALGDFQRSGLELDPDGFLIVCRGLEKALFASFDVPSDHKSAVFAKCPPTVVTDEFIKLSGTGNMDSTYSPELLHSIHGVHLHAYVRVLGMIEDYVGVIRVLKWMQTHQETLDELATQSRSGPNQIRRVFIAMRAFLKNTSCEADAQSIVNSIQSWGGWPQESEVQEYLELWPGGSKDGVEYQVDG